MRPYNSLLEYGGWGIRVGSPKTGNAINTSIGQPGGFSSRFREGDCCLSVRQSLMNWNASWNKSTRQRNRKISLSESIFNHGPLYRSIPVKIEERIGGSKILECPFHQFPLTAPLQKYCMPGRLLHPQVNMPAEAANVCLGISEEGP